MTNTNRNTLFESILRLETVDDVSAFFGDLCSESELESMTLRYEVARMLSVGLTYIEIEERTNISAATISRIAKCLNRTSSGYKKAIERL